MLYIPNTYLIDQDQGISVLRKAIAACTEEIERHKGKLTVKEPPRAVSITFRLLDYAYYSFQNLGFYYILEIVMFPSIFFSGSLFGQVFVFEA